MRHVLPRSGTGVGYEHSYTRFLPPSRPGMGARDPDRPSRRLLGPPGSHAQGRTGPPAGPHGNAAHRDIKQALPRKSHVTVVRVAPPSPSWLAAVLLLASQGPCSRSRSPGDRLCYGLSRDPTTCPLTRSPATPHIRSRTLCGGLSSLPPSLPCNNPDWCRASGKPSSPHLQRGRGTGIRRAESGCCPGAQQGDSDRNSPEAWPSQPGVGGTDSPPTQHR